jgi:hypothetical protein
MIKLITVMRRPSQFSLDEFQSHWLEYHSHLGRRIKPMRRYVQYHTLANDPTGKVMPQAIMSTLEPFDGAAVGWFDSGEAMQSAMEKDTDTAAGLEDMKLFIDLSRTVPSVTQEQVIVEPEGSVPYVLIGCLRRRSELDRAQFQEAWRKHAEIGRRGYAQGHLMGYIQNYTLIEEAGGADAVGAPQEPFDGIAMLYFESVIKFKELAASSLAQEVFEEEKNFVDHSQTAYMLTRRYVIKDIVR